MCMTSRLRAAVNTRDGSIDAHGQHTRANTDRNSESAGADIAFLVSVSDAPGKELRPKVGDGMKG